MAFFFFLSFEELITPHCKAEEVTFCFYFLNAGPYFIICHMTFFPVISEKIDLTKCKNIQNLISFIQS